MLPSIHNDLIDLIGQYGLPAILDAISDELDLIATGMDSTCKKICPSADIRMLSAVVCNASAKLDECLELAC